MGKKHFHILMLASILVGSNANAWKVFNNWEGITFPPGHRVNIALYDTKCTDSQAVIMDRAIRGMVFNDNRLDPSRTYVYLGRTIWPGWNNSQDDIVTIDCADPDQLLPGRWGEAAPIQNCVNQRPDDYTMCIDGRKRHIIDAFIRVNNKTPDFLLAKVTIHEYLHGVHALDHSTTPGATMTTGIFSTPLSAQIQETLSRDDWCAYHFQHPDMTEWPIVTPSIDDELFIHIPSIRWLGFPWELIMIHKTIGKWEAAQNAQRVPTCESLKQ